MTPPAVRLRNDVLPAAGLLPRCARTIASSGVPSGGPLPSHAGRPRSAMRPHAGKSLEAPGWVLRPVVAATGFAVPTYAQPRARLGSLTGAVSSKLLPKETPFVGIDGDTAILLRAYGNARLRMMRSNVGKICRERGMTLCGLAGACGLSPDTLYGWERHGMERAQLRAVLLVADCLGVEPRELVRGDPKVPGRWSR